MYSQFIKSNHIQLHVMTDGPANGPAVILLHGFPEFHYGWHKQIPALVQAGFHVIVPDQRGYNLSDKPKGISSYDINMLTADVIGLLDHFKLDRAFLVGHDWGAAIAWNVAIHFPDRLRKLAILNVPHPDVMTDFLLHNAVQRKKSWYVFFFQIPVLVEWILRWDHFRAMEWMLRGSSDGSRFTSEDLQEYKKAWSQPRALTAMLNWYRAAVRRGTRSLFRKKTPPRRVSVPTLILWGKQDAALNHEMVTPSLALCDDGRAVLFEKSTHWVQHDEAEQVNKNLIRFLR
jgi:pimeloyl-ACP methyl ester carboxylesterase